jgi:prolyl-tRNA editing enzyme YbaK/EbsC (Cys-tRNA(Pro) deacylase)
MSTARGNLDWAPAAEALEDVAPAVADALRSGSAPGAEIARIDPELADTAAFCERYEVPLEASANCVVVLGRRGETRTRAAVMVLATDRADVNKRVRKHLDARKISFADQDEVEQDTGMTSGGITPVGLPEGWPILVDERVAASTAVVIGGGMRGAKLLVPGAELARLPGAEVLDLVVAAD